MTMRTFMFCKRFTLLLILCCLPTPLLLAQQLKWKDQQQAVVVPVGSSSVNVDFHFTNTSDRTISILSVKPQCGCTLVKEAASEVLPHHDGVIQLIFNSEGYTGMVKKQVAVESNDSAYPVIILTFTAQIRVPIMVQPRVVSWALQDLPTSKQISIKLDPDLASSVITVQPEDSNVRVKLIKSSQCQYTLEVAPMTTKTPLLRAIAIYADLPNGVRRAITSYVVVKSASQTTVDIN